MTASTDELSRAANLGAFHGLFSGNHVLGLSGIRRVRIYGVWWGWARKNLFVINWGFTFLHLGIFMLIPMVSTALGWRWNHMPEWVQMVHTAYGSLALVSLFWIPRFLLPKWFLSEREQTHGAGRVPMPINCTTEPSDRASEGELNPIASRHAGSAEGAPSAPRMIPFNTPNLSGYYPEPLEPVNLVADGDRKPIEGVEIALALKNIHPSRFAATLVITSRPTTVSLAECVW